MASAPIIHGEHSVSTANTVWEKAIVPKLKFIEYAPRIFNGLLFAAVNLIGGIFVLAGGTLKLLITLCLIKQTSEPESSKTGREV